MSRLILIFGDQLSPGISSLDGADKGRDTVLMCEVMAEATYVGHHKKKIAFIFSAMRHFADELRTAGYKVRYVRIDDPDNVGSFSGEVQRAHREIRAESICVTEPGEWRVLKEIRSWPDTLGLQIDMPTTFSA